VVEVPSPATVIWRKSSRSGGGECVEVAGAHDYVWVRDSKSALGPILGFARGEWAAFLARVQRGEFDALLG